MPIFFPASPLESRVVKLHTLRLVQAMESIASPYHERVQLYDSVLQHVLETIKVRLSRTTQDFGVRRLENQDLGVWASAYKTTRRPRFFVLIPPRYSRSLLYHIQNAFHWKLHVRRYHLRH